MKFFYTIVNLSNIKLGLTKTNASEIISKIISMFTIKRFLSAKLRKKTHFPPRQVPTILRKRTKLKGKLILLKNKIIKRITKKSKTVTRREPKIRREKYKSGRKASSSGPQIAAIITRKAKRKQDFFIEFFGNKNL